VEAIIAAKDLSPIAEIPNSCPVVVSCAQGNSSVAFTEGLRKIGIDAHSLRGGAAAWGSYYETNPLALELDLTILQISRPARGCLSYFVASGTDAAIIDPLRHLSPYEAAVESGHYNVKHVIDTHGHADHLSGGPTAAKRFQCQYFLHPYDAIHPFDTLCGKLEYEFLQEGMELQVGKSLLRIFHVPGHTLGNIAILVNNKFLLAGDTLFLNSVSRPDLGNRSEEWGRLHFQSLRRLLELPDSTIVLPGHFQDLSEAPERVFSRTLGGLKASNQDLQIVSHGEAAFLERVRQNTRGIPPNYIDIKRVNAGLIHVDESRAAELELGRNECALRQHSL
jgi:glyoxylase-like metal-dependent hydrolase (beta-lactamase superfamily II)